MCHDSNINRGSSILVRLFKDVDEFRYTAYRGPYAFQTCNYNMLSVVYIEHWYHIACGVGAGLLKKIQHYKYESCQKQQAFLKEKLNKIRLCDWNESLVADLLLYFLKVRSFCRFCMCYSLITCVT